MKTNIQKVIDFLEHKKEEGFANLTVHTMMEVVHFVKAAEEEGLEITGIKYRRFDGKEFKDTPPEEFHFEGGFSAKKIERPVVKHKHTQGDWIPENLNIDKDKVIKSKETGKVLFKVLQNDNEKANALLASESPKLLQIAEMYFDSMQGKGMEGSLPYQITAEVLNRINPE